MGYEEGGQLTEAPTVIMTSNIGSLHLLEAYDPVDGARPLRRIIQREVETRIERALLSGEILDGAKITLDADGDELVVSWRNPNEAEEAVEPEPVGAGA